MILDPYFVLGPVLLGTVDKSRLFRQMLLHLKKEEIPKLEQSVVWFQRTIHTPLSEWSSHISTCWKPWSTCGFWRVCWDMRALKEALEVDMEVVLEEEAVLEVVLEVEGEVEWTLDRGILWSIPTFLGLGVDLTFSMGSTQTQSLHRHTRSRCASNLMSCCLIKSFVGFYELPNGGGEELGGKGHRQLWEVCGDQDDGIQLDHRGYGASGWGMQVKSFYVENPTFTCTLLRWQGGVKGVGDSDDQRGVCLCPATTEKLCTKDRSSCFFHT